MRAALDLLLLVASDAQPVHDIVAREGERARRACPGDPTPGWLLGQYQSTQALPEISATAGFLDPATGLATFRRLVRELPGSGAAWAGEADALVRLAASTPAEQPWVARHRYERALARYRRAARLSPGPEMDMGIARALAGLGRADEAVALQERAVAAVPPAPLPQAQLVVYLEAARRFGAAAGAADRLLGLARTAPAGPGLFPDIEMTGPHFALEEAHGLISLGAGRLAPLAVALKPLAVTVAPGAVVGDLSFIPEFRGSGLIGSDRWCADWARRRDLVLAGRPAEALARFPAAFEPLPGHGDLCASTGFESVLADIALLEQGDRRSAGARTASEWVMSHRAALAFVDDERQNLWRWAGDLARAERAAREWVAAAPRATLPLLRLGEIEFLRQRYDEAARDFGAAARRARERTRPSAQDEVRALLDRGAALVAAGRVEEGRDALLAADEVASRGLADPVLQASAYHARVQLAEAAREAGDLPAAADAYAAARERVARLKDTGEPFHFEQLENNSAIVDAALGRVDSAVASTQRALAVDPENPALLMTAGFAAERAGQ